VRGDAEKYAKKIAPYLRDGESVLVAARTNYKAGVQLAAGLAGGLIGAAIASKTVANDAAPTGSIAEQVRARPRTLWVLTNQRMLFFEHGNLRLGEPTSVIDNGYVASVVARKAKVRFGKLTFTFQDGSGIELDLLIDREVPRINDAAASLFGAPA
jgi:hypothetical protein